MYAMLQLPGQYSKISIQHQRVGQIVAYFYHHMIQSEEYAAEEYVTAQKEVNDKLQSEKPMETTRPCIK